MPHRIVLRESVVLKQDPTYYLPREYIVCRCHQEIYLNNNPRLAETYKCKCGASYVVTKDKVEITEPCTYCEHDNETRQLDNKHWICVLCLNDVIKKLRTNKEHHIQLIYDAVIALKVLQTDIEVKEGMYNTWKVEQEMGLSADGESIESSETTNEEVK